MSSIEIPGTKSYVNRALICAALASGKSILKHAPEGEDIDFMIRSLKQLGVKLIRQGTSITVFGFGGTLKPRVKSFFTGNAGTTTRFLTALLSLVPASSIVRGDKYMAKRPINDLVHALQTLGADISTKTGCPPVHLGKGILAGGKCILDASTSSQFLSALLLVSPMCKKPVEIRLKGRLSSKPYIDMTLEVMNAFGVHVDHDNYRVFCVDPQQYRCCSFKIQGDLVAGSYFAGLAALHHFPLMLRNVYLNNVRGEVGFYSIFKKMGANLKPHRDGLVVQGLNGRLKALGDVDGNAFPDSILTLAVLATQADGVTTFRNIGHLRAKETDRLHALATEIGRLGFVIQEGKTFLRIHGLKGHFPRMKDGSPRKILIHTYGDHRIAMAFSLLKSLYPLIDIQNPQCVAKSYPSFWKDYFTVLKSFGRNIVLIGMPGSGKTTLGKYLAQRLDYKLVDIDQEIEKKFGMSIAEFSKKYGWKCFRTEEMRLIKKISQRTHQVITPGGGGIVDSRNEKNLRCHGIVVYLKAPLHFLEKRIREDPLSFRVRPHFVGPKLKDILQRRYKKRSQRYLVSADMILDATQKGTSKNDELFLKSGFIFDRLFPYAKD